MNTRFKTISWLSLVVALCSMSVWGCGDDDAESQPPARDDGGQGNAGHGGRDGGSAGKSDAAADDGGGGHHTGGGGGHSGSGSHPDGGVAHLDGGGLPNGDGGVTCFGADGCYACDDKTSDEQFLNQCTDSQAEPFDNDARIKFKLPSKKYWKQGDDLPPIP